MATATKSSSTTPATSRRPVPQGPLARAAGATFHFLASLKLAVISLLSLSALLGVATWLESRYGTRAAAEIVYQNPIFVVVLGFLATNILCAALIRYPWKLRQIGFVVTHVGLLVVLAGALVTYLAADEGTYILNEGEGKGREVLMNRDQSAVLRVRVPDVSGNGSTEFSHPFRPGVWAWKPGRYEKVTDPDYFLKPLIGPFLPPEPEAPYKLAVKAFLPSSRPRYLHEAVAGGQGEPMIRLKLAVQPPNALTPFDPLQEDNVLDRNQWLVADDLFRHASRDLSPARFSFQYADTPEMVADFLDPPGEGLRKAARLHYQDKAGKTRSYDWDLEGDGGKSGKAVTLPDSDFTATLVEQSRFPDRGGSIAAATGWPGGPPVVKFRVRKGDGPEEVHAGWASLPMGPGYVGEKGTGPLLTVGYFHPPLAGGFGVVEVMGTSAGQLSYRVFGRTGMVAKGPLEPKTMVRAFGGPGSKAPMSLQFAVEEFLPSGRERFVYEPLELPVGQLSEAIQACLVELTVDGKSKEVWLRRHEGYTSEFTPVKFQGAEYGLCFDNDRLPLGFALELEDLKVGVNPGTKDSASFESKVRLTDESLGIKDQPSVIAMNEPLTHRHYTFYQSRWDKVRDNDRRPTGQLTSIFQIGYDPGRVVKYTGSLLVVLGAFLQFTMRAGIFTDGGKAERARAAAKAARLAGKGTTPVEPAPDADADADMETI